jgi:hypothetical protein
MIKFRESALKDAPFGKKWQFLPVLSVQGVLRLTRSAAVSETSRSRVNIAAADAPRTAALRPMPNQDAHSRRLGWTKFLAGRKIAAMKPRVAHQKTAALTLFEVMVVIVLVVALALFILPMFHGGPVPALDESTASII